MKVEEIIKIQFINKNLPKLNESEREEILNEVINDKELIATYCGKDLFSGNITIENLMSTFINQRALKKRFQYEYDNPNDKYAFLKPLKDCRTQLLKSIYNRIRVLVKKK